MFGVADIDRAVPGKSLPVAAAASRQHAIEHVDAALNRPNQIVGFAHTHQVSRPVSWKHVGCIIKATKHRLLPLTHGKAAHGIAIKTDIDQGIRTFLAQLFIERPLLDSKQRRALGMLTAAVETVAAAFCPAHRQRHRFRRLFARHTIGRAFVERHHDIRTQQALDFHRSLG